MRCRLLLANGDPSKLMNTGGHLPQRGRVNGLPDRQTKFLIRSCKGIDMGNIIRHSSKRPTRQYPTIGVCGLDCGLCPRFYTVGSSRCPGCAGSGFYDKHPTCSFITCCVRNKHLEVCSECSDFPCAKFKSAEEYKQVTESSSYPSCKKILPNLYFIKEHGVKKFIQQQRKRIKLLETMIDQFDDGRSRSFFCRAALFHDSTALANSIAKATKMIRKTKIKRNDMKSKANVLKTMINDIPFAEQL